MGTFRRRNPLDVTALGVSAAVLVLTAAPASAHDQRYKFDIPSLNLDLALQDFERTTDLRLVYEVHNVQNLRSHALKGELTRGAGLARLLTGSGLVSTGDERSGVMTIQGVADSATAQVARATVPPSPDAKPPSDQADIVVTGSRIARREIDSPNPVVVLSAATIEQSGRTNITDFLAQFPALLGSQTTTGQDAVNLLSLRDLGSERTLVLVDGLRHVSGVPGSQAVDIRTIPQDLIERVDIETGGASAVYGADAVSGVVNFVLKHDFEGIRLRGQSGISSAGDVGTRFFSATLGKNFADGRGNIALAYDFSQDDLVEASARANGGDPFATYYLNQNPDDLPDENGRDNPNLFDNVIYNNVRYQDSSRDGAVDLDLDGIPDFTGSGKPYDRGRLLDGPFVEGGNGTPLAGYGGYLAPRSRTHNVNLLGSFRVSDALRVFAQGKYVNIKSETEGQPNYDFFTYLTPDNAYLNDRFGAGETTQGAFLSRDNFDLGADISDEKRETLRGVIGADGRISDHARYTLSYVYGRTRQISISRNQRLADRYYAALDAGRDPATGAITCRINLPGETVIDPNNYAGIYAVNNVPVSGLPVTFQPGQCVPLDLLGENVRSQAAVDFVNADETSRFEVYQHDVSGSITGDFGQIFSLPGGPVNFSLGGEYRVEGSDARSDDYTNEGFFLDYPPSPRSRGKFDVYEGFAELRAPLLKDVRFAKLLEVGAALRLSHYSTVGQTTTWAINGVYAPVGDIRFRGTYSQAVRAPNISELFSPLARTYNFVNDPCDPSRLAEGTKYRAANCQALLAATGLSPEKIAHFNPDADPLATLALPGTTSGNLDLNQETARTWTAGLVLTPSFVPRLSITADWYDIDLKNAIRTDDINAIANQCVDEPSIDNQFCALITRSPTTGYVSDYSVKPQNVARFATAGLDLAINYNFTAPAKIGYVSLHFVGNYLHKLTSVGTPGTRTINNLEGGGAPKYSANFDATLTHGPFQLNYGLNYFSGLLRFSRDTIRANPDISDPRYFHFRDHVEHDLQLSIDAGKQFNFYFGANNLTNAIGDAGEPFAPYSYVGRTFYAGARIQLGKLF